MRKQQSRRNLFPVLNVLICYCGAAFPRGDQTRWMKSETLLPFYMQGSPPGLWLENCLSEHLVRKPEEHGGICE